MKARVLEHHELPDLERRTGVPGIWRHVWPEDIKALAIEDGGALLATVSMIQMTHLESLWIRPESRGNPGVVRMLLREIGAQARQDALRWAVAGASSAYMADLVRRIGGHRIETDWYALPVIGQGERAAFVSARKGD